MASPARVKSHHFGRNSFTILLDIGSRNYRKKAKTFGGKAKSITYELAVKLSISTLQIFLDNVMQD